MRQSKTLRENVKDFEFYTCIPVLAVNMFLAF
jgi:hypothetical protein